MVRISMQASPTLSWPKMTWVNSEDVQSISFTHRTGDYAHYSIYFSLLRSSIDWRFCYDTGDFAKVTQAQAKKEFDKAVSYLQVVFGIDKNQEVL